MPEPIDFDHLARTLLIERWELDLITDATEEMIRDVAEQLRQVWNARGAADLAKVNGSLLTGDVPKLVDTLRSLDR